MKHKRSVISIAMATLVVVSLCAVCASTSVSAAPSSSANATTSAALVGAPAGVVGAPAVCSQAANSYDLFVRGTDNALYWRHEAGGVWGSWVNLGGFLTSSPAATSPHSSGYLAVLARGGDGALWTIRGLNGGWGKWYSLGGRLLEGTGPAACSYAETLAYFVTGNDHALWEWIGMGGSNNWKKIGGYLTSSPSATSYASNEITIAARGRNGAVWAIYTLDGGTSWYAWESWGGKLLEGTGPAAVYDGFTIKAAVIGTNSALFWWDNYAWASLGGRLTSSPAAASHSMNVVDVFARGGNGNLWSRHTVNGGTSWDLWHEVAG